MTKRYQLLFAAIPLFLLLQSTLFAQPGGQGATIVGPQSLCIGNCGTYQVVLADTSLEVEVINWSSSTGSVVGSVNPIDYCPQITVPGYITLFASVIAIGPNGFTAQYNAELQVVISTSLNPTIVPTIATCPQDSSGGIGGPTCEKICAFGTAQYEVMGVPTGTPVTWSVQGAESFTPNGNTVTVEWGAPGYGQVSVVAGGNSPGIEPFQTYCGQTSLITPNQSGAAYLNIFGGTPPYDVIITVNGSPQPPVTISNNTFTYTVPQPGLISFNTIDADGYTYNCNTNVFNNSQNCWVSATPTSIVHPTDVNSCNGNVSFTAIGGQPPYTYTWSNGSTAPIVSNLCCGTYQVSVTDASGCTSNENVSLACPQPTCSGETSLCVEILEEPEVQIGSLPAPQPNGTIAICQGQTIYFQNNSLNATSYVWDFGNLNTSTQFEPSQTYNVPGTYIVSLIARNECYCADTTQVEVYVLAADVPDINCTGTICEGETVTYSTDANCGTYTWALTGSYNILDGGTSSDNFITVEWLAGPEGTISLAVIGCSGTVCTLPNVVPIPIVSDNVEIQGPSKVCEGSTEEYYIPDYQGTSINWTVLGSGNITDGQGTERITVNWFGNANQGNPQRVIVEFDNCYLGCSGKDTLNVNIVPGFYTTGPIEVCGNSSGNYQAINTISGAPVPSNWQVINSSGTVVWSSASPTANVNISFNFPAGVYTVHAAAASASGYCNNDYDIFIKLVAPPPAPTAITGEDEICPGLSYSYEATGLATTDFTWTLTGATTANFSGNPANVIWGNTPPYTVSVVQTSTTGLGCTSSPATLNVNPIPAFTVTGDGQVCREQMGTYAAPFYENIDYQWVISPATAGTIINGTGTEQVEVLWHTDGPATVSVTICGATQNYNVTVLPLPEPVAQAPADLCFGETAAVQTTIPFASYVWNDVNGTQLSTLPNPVFGAGNYEVEVTDANGCMGDTIFDIVEHVFPPVSISLPQYSPVCPGGPALTIYSVVTGAGGYTYQWQLNGNPIGGNTPTLSITQAGDYTLVITDLFGCTAQSNTQTIYDCATLGGTCVNGVCVLGGPCMGDCTVCPPCNPGPVCVINGNIDFTSAPSANCSTIDFTNTSVNFQPGSMEWYFGDPASGANNTSTLQNPSHIYSALGYYTVQLVGLVQDASDPNVFCVDWIRHDVLIPIQAIFESTTACPNSPMQFTDRSIWVSGASIVGWSWNFGDPGSGAANTSASQNPTHIFSAPGTYNVTLTITEASGCTVFVTQPVMVFTPPAVGFVLPSATCENTSLPFDAMVGSEVASVYWDFGDPLSGDGNSSELINSHHEFDAPGSYTVALTALSIEGCTNVFSSNMTITPNNLSGNITTTPPSPLCEGESTTLTSPSGGISWLWSDNSVANNISVSTSGIYAVTLTDATGCTYVPPPAVVDVFGEPNGIIKAVEYNEFGQPVAFFENNHSVCAGDDVFLVIQGSSNNSYQWSNSSTGDEVEFSEDKGTLLPVGTHNFTVTVTDVTTGCTAIEGPFTVTVNPVPTVTIASSPSGFICENTSATLNVTGPNATYNYQWNTGETGASIAVIAGGTYFATAINTFGCKGLSNEIDIHNAPDIDLVPTGCHTRCQPDTMCLPIVPEVASYQWLWNGSPMSAPNGTLANPIFAQSGEYAVVLTDIYGCTSTSDVLTLDLFPGFGDIVGDVYFDVNGNGIIDATDTLVSNINIFLNNGTANIDTVSSSVSTGYNFVDILSTNYILYLDSLNLPLGWSAVWSSSSLTLSGCDVEEQFDWLLTTSCAPSTASVNLTACPGSSADYNGTLIPVGASQNFMLTNALGCDSIVTVTVTPLATSTGSETLTACPGTSAVYNGTPIAAGSSMDFTLTNWLGCDSVVTVTVTPLLAPTSSLALTACPGGFANYNGTMIPVGTSMDFLFASNQNCDSVVTVTVTALQTSTSTVNLSACVGASANYNGTPILAGASQNFTLTNWLGCDSVVTVNVAALQPSTSALGLTACPGTSANYNGTPILAGASQNFTLTNWVGCDSVVTVNVVALPASTLIVDGMACAGSFFDYNGNQIAAGTSQTFYEVNASGCMDTVIVGVVAVPTSASSIQLPACPGSTVTYGGMALSAGDVQDFTFTNWLNCDSVVTVTVIASQSSTTQLALQVCEGKTVSYNGQELSAGQQFTWVGTNQAGCDSVVYVNVTALPTVAYDLVASQVCWNALDGSIAVGNINGSTGPYQFSLNGTGFQSDTLFEGLPPGEYTVAVQDMNGCIFSVNTSIASIPPLEAEAQDETLVCGETVMLKPLIISDLPVAWEWSDSSGVISTANELLVDKPGIYFFSVVNACEMMSGEIQVIVEPLSPVGLIYLPNSFSPNDDGINDCYRGYIDPQVELLDYELKIFDRWGDLLFETEDIEGCWDGWFRGKHMNPAVMVYWMRMHVRNCDGQVVEVFRKGDVHLVR